MSSPHHPQTDGASEVMTRMVENYIRCYCSLQQDDWDVLLPAADFAYNSAESQNLGMSPFEIDLGWKPKLALDLLHKDFTPVESVNEFKTRLRAALELAQFAHELAKAKNAAYSARKYEPHPYKVGDKVRIDKELFKDAITKTQKSAKLGAKRFGPFSITELIGRNALRVDLPSNMKLHAVIHVLHTTPFCEQPRDISQPVIPRPDPIPGTDGTPLFKVDRVLQHRKRGRGYQFLILLEGTPQHEATRQPTLDFVDTDGTLTEAFLEYIKLHKLLPHLWEENN